MESFETLLKWDAGEFARLLDGMSEVELPDVDIGRLMHDLAALMSEVCKRHAGNVYRLEWRDGACEIDLDDVVRLRIERARGGVRLVFEKIEK